MRLTFPLGHASGIITTMSGKWVQANLPDGSVRQDWVPADQPPSPDGSAGVWHVVEKTPGQPTRWEWHATTPTPTATPPLSVPPPPDVPGAGEPEVGTSGQTSPGRRQHVGSDSRRDEPQSAIVISGPGDDGPNPQAKRPRGRRRTVDEKTPLHPGPSAPAGPPDDQRAAFVIGAIWGAFVAFLPGVRTPVAATWEKVSDQGTSGSGLGYALLLAILIALYVVGAAGIAWSFARAFGRRPPAPDRPASA